MRRHKGRTYWALGTPAAAVRPVKYLPYDPAGNQVGFQQSKEQRARRCSHSGASCFVFAPTCPVPAGEEQVLELTVAPSCNPRASEGEKTMMYSRKMHIKANWKWKRCHGGGGMLPGTLGSAWAGKGEQRGPSAQV